MGKDIQIAALSNTKAQRPSEIMTTFEFDWIWLYSPEPLLGSSILTYSGTSNK
jgi:hypothetical protein